MTVATVFTNIHHSNLTLARGSSVMWSFVTIVGSWPSTPSTSFSRSPLFLFSISSLSDMLRSVLSELLDSLLDGKGSRREGLDFSSLISLSFSASAFNASITKPWDTCKPWRRLRLRWLERIVSAETWLVGTSGLHPKRDGKVRNAE